MIYFDNKGHLVSDESMQELHAFAKRIGLKLEWFQNKGHRIKHYDLTTEKAKIRAEKAGAKKISSKEKEILDYPYQVQSPYYRLLKRKVYFSYTMSFAVRTAMHQMKL